VRADRGATLADAVVKQHLIDTERLAAFTLTGDACGTLPAMVMPHIAGETERQAAAAVGRLAAAHRLCDRGWPGGVAIGRRWWRAEHAARAASDVRTGPTVR
jgi:hypothetical protein